MKQLVILSGKGGTGKTSVAAVFSHLAAAGPEPVSAVLADADVDAANLELVLAPDVLEEHDFRGGQRAIIDARLCAQCGDCLSVCRFDAIHELNDTFVVDPLSCEGCAACYYSCPNEAISMEDQVVGKWFRSQCRYGPLFHAALRPAQENSGKLVTTVKQHARQLALDEGNELLIVDGPPGIGCPVISAVTGADLALIVTEPSAAGVHDMQRILQTTAHFGIQTLVCINKSDLYPQGTAEITSCCQDHDVKIIGSVPFDTVVTEAMIHGAPVTAYQSTATAAQAMRLIWTRTIEAIQDSGN